MCQCGVGTPFTWFSSSNSLLVTVAIVIRAARRRVATGRRRERRKGTWPPSQSDNLSPHPFEQEANRLDIRERYSDFAGIPVLDRPADLLPCDPFRHFEGRPLDGQRRSALVEERGGAVDEQFIELPLWLDGRIQLRGARVN